MAAPMLSVRCSEQVTRLLSARLQSCLDLCKRKSLHCSPGKYAGQNWRVRRGFARSDSEYGPLTDLPDWSFADGRPAPLWKGQIRRKDERETLARRVILLSTEMDKGMDNWHKKQQDNKAEQLLKEKSKLKSKAFHKKEKEM
ncbi:hypothetical protein GDO86_001570 [Hymenochirus boettgeri]|uniref:Large ribosomal subunit protein mL52 n=1 Tax=Hymenochirus boettgeri TaxID=247094 RepID=A0A8T2KHN6_9PIPI|nr:hypothetical protein GDO86_001570 [Hymenochirus boettgeri]